MKNCVMVRNGLKAVNNPPPEWAVNWPYYSKGGFMTVAMLFPYKTGS